MGSTKKDICAHCGAREYDMTFVTYYINAAKTKGGLLCKKHEIIAARKREGGIDGKS